MSKALPLLAAAIALSTPAPLAAQFRGDDDGKAAEYGWLSSLAAGKEQARKTGRPMMVVIRCVP